MKFSQWLCLAAIATPVAIAAPLFAQQEAPPPPQGTVLFHRDAESSPEPVADSQKPVAPLAEAVEADRSAITFTSYDLDLHLNPAKSSFVVRAKVSVRNDSESALARIPLQISSSLHWESAKTGSSNLKLQQQVLRTDVDHTGAVTEAIVDLPNPLAAHETAQLDLFYSGTIEQDSTRSGSSSAAATADWDRLTAAFVGLRGFGNVLWYPVSAPPASLGDGASLIELAARVRQRSAEAMVKAHLTVEYTGEPPKLAYLCGRREFLEAHPENPNMPTVDAPGIATADWAAFQLGFHPLSLFLSLEPETPSAGGLLSVVSSDPTRAAAFNRAAAKLQPLFDQWLGARPLEPLTLFDLGESAQPFEQGSFLAVPLAAADQEAAEAVLAHAFTHAWSRNGQLWLDEGLAQFMSLLWTEQSRGREAAIADLASLQSALALAEPDPGKENAPSGESLTTARSEVYYRTKAAHVLWMLRAIAGDEALEQALQALRSQKNIAPDTFELLLERTSQKDLSWFFADWVENDRGLPDLSISSIKPRLIENNGGYLIAVEASNDGFVTAEVPVTVRSGALTITERLRVPARSRATTRIVFNGKPEEVQLNDGSTPEQRTSLHTLQVNLKTLP